MHHYICMENLVPKHNMKFRVTRAKLIKMALLPNNFVSGFVENDRSCNSTFGVGSDTKLFKFCLFYPNIIFTSMYTSPTKIFWPWIKKKMIRNTRKIQRKVSKKMLYLAKGTNKTKKLIFFFSEKNHFFVSIKKALMGMRMAWELQEGKL